MAIEVLITVPFSEILIERIMGVSPKLNVTCIAGQKPTDISSDVWAKAEILYTANVLPEPELVPALHWIQFHFAGIDRYIQEPLIKKENLLVTTLSGAAVSQMAEHILAMLLAFSRKIPALIASQRKSEWPKDRFERFAPVELRGRTVGIVGYGSIGRQVARLLEPFGARVVATKRDIRRPVDEGYIPNELGDIQGDYVKILYPPQAIRSMLKECDYVIVALPLTPETNGLFDASLFAAMKPGAYLVDISRGGIVDHTALIASLKDGKLAGAALDVFPEEPLPANKPLWQMQNVIISPHISGSSTFYDERAVEMFIVNLNRYLSGMSLYNLYDPRRNY